MKHQKEKLLDHLKSIGCKTFSLQDLANNSTYSKVGIGGDTPKATLERLLQELRNDKSLSFLDNNGHYELL